MKDFNAFGLTPSLLQAVQELGFETPTPVQSKVIPLILQNTRDLVVLAQTGTGKTAAYGLPLLHLTDPQDRATQALILCPTRELCLQIVKDLTAFARHTRDVRIVAVYGGSSIVDQIRALNRGAQVIVATPGRMLDVLRRKRADLSGVKRVVLDEADEMMNMGFQEDMEAILKEVPDASRRLLFSATMPRQVAAMAGKYMQDPEEVLLGRRNSGSDTVTHECYKVHAKDRYAALRRLIDVNPGLYAIVFCRTRAETQFVATKLTADGYNADALHGDLTQNQRDSVMNAFRARTTQILVATDVAARGLDVNDLSHVINYNLPDEADLYTHRSGRTGRAGKVGISMAIIHVHEEHKLRAIESILKKQFVNKPVPSGEQVCAAQLSGLLQRIRQINVDETPCDGLMPAVRALVEELSPEEMAKRLILRDFARFLADYRQAPDLNAGVCTERRAYRERGGRQPDAERRSDADAAQFRINLGHRNELTPAALIGLINRATRGPMRRVGRIHIMDQASVFQMLPEDARTILPYLNGSVFNQREVRVVPVTGGTGNRPPHHRAGDARLNAGKPRWRRARGMPG